MRVIAKFTDETKEAILNRDGHICIIDNCDNQVSDIHHVYFGLQNESDESRNNIDKGVALCRECHKKCHGCKSGNGIRQTVINYLIKYYGKKN